MDKSKAGLTSSEELVNELSSSSFLRLWTHPNPIGKGGKDLCDCLVVCGPHLIIISVKEIEFRDTSAKVGWERWQKSAIDKSVQQILRIPSGLLSQFGNLNSQRMFEVSSPSS